METFAKCRRLHTLCIKEGACSLINLMNNEESQKHREFNFPSVQGRQEQPDKTEEYR